MPPNNSIISIMYYSNHVCLASLCLKTSAVPLVPLTAWCAATEKHRTYYPTAQKFEWSVKDREGIGKWHVTDNAVLRDQEFREGRVLHCSFLLFITILPLTGVSFELLNTRNRRNAAPKFSVWKRKKNIPCHHLSNMECSSTFLLKQVKQQEWYHGTVLSCSQLPAWLSRFICTLCFQVIGVICFSSLLFCSALLRDCCVNWIRCQHLVLAFRFHPVFLCSCAHLHSITETELCTWTWLMLLHITNFVVRCKVNSVSFCSFESGYEILSFFLS